MKFDLHTHSTASDGRCTPSQLVDKAIKNDVDFLAITDHDTTNGINEALKYSANKNIKIIPGIELSTVHNKESIHILGYFKDDSYKMDTLQSFLQELKESRINRAKKIIENLKNYFNIEIFYEDIKDNYIIARPHIAKAIIKRGYNYTFNEIFEKFISKDSPAYVENKNIPLEDGIKILKKHNAIVSLAHPCLIKKSNVEDLIKNYDFDCIEAYYSIHTEYDTAKYINLGRKFNKLLTCGSDFHGIENDSKHSDLGSIIMNPTKAKEFLDALYK
ncbi:PHP domain-containing protein [Clostridium sp. CTA-19]